MKKEERKKGEELVVKKLSIHNKNPQKLTIEDIINTNPTSERIPIYKLPNKAPMRSPNAVELPRRKQLFMINRNSAVKLVLNETPSLPDKIKLNLDLPSTPIFKKEQDASFSKLLPQPKMTLYKYMTTHGRPALHETITEAENETQST